MFTYLIMRLMLKTFLNQILILCMLKVSKKNINVKSSIKGRKSRISKDRLLKYFA